MDTAGRNVLYTIAMKLPLPDLLSWCGSSDKIYKDVCNNENLWRNRLLRDYPDYQNFISQDFDINTLSLKEAYVFLYQLSWIKKILNTNKNEYDIFLSESLNLIGKGLTKVPAFNLPNLKKLLLDKNQLAKVPSFNLPNLQELHLRDNRLTEVPSFDLPNLRQLQLTNNQLTKVPSFNLPNLERLYLPYNQLTEIPSFNLPNLQSLVLTNNKLTKIPLFNLPRLQYFYLADNELTEVPQFSLPNLQWFSLVNNPLTEETKKKLKETYKDKVTTWKTIN